MQAMHGVQKDTASEDWRRECEARAWIADYRGKLKKSKKVADNWWETMKNKIRDARGQDGLQELLNEMQRIRNESRES